MIILLRLFILFLAYALCLGCAPEKKDVIGNAIVVIGTVIEIDNAEETRRFTLLDTTILGNVLISVDTIDGNALSEFTPIIIVIPQSFESSLNIEGALSEFFVSGQKWRFEARRFERSDSPLEVGSYVEGIPMLLIAEHATLVKKETGRPKRRRPKRG